MQDRALHFIAALTTAILALMLVGGSVYGWLIGRDLPQWLVGFDGMIVAAAFATGAFFAQARAAEPTGNALADMAGRYHQLAMAGLTAATPTGGTAAIPVSPPLTTGDRTSSPLATSSTTQAGGS